MYERTYWLLPLETLACLFFAAGLLAVRQRQKRNIDLGNKNMLLTASKRSAASKCKKDEQWRAEERQKDQRPSCDCCK